MTLPLRLATGITITLLQASLCLRGADWPGWRGPKQDGRTADPLPSNITGQPEALWRMPLGHGFAGPAVAAGRLVVLDDSTSQETVRCLDARTGTELWKTPFAEFFADEFEPGPRCTPLIDGDRVYVQGCKGEFRCLSLSDGAVRWRLHFRDFGAIWVPDRQANIGAASRRGNTGAPVIVGDRIVVQVGSTNGAGVVAFDKHKGTVLWKSLNDMASYSSLIATDLAGRRQVVSATVDGLVGLDPEDGMLLWRVPVKTRANRHVVTPVADGSSILFASFTTGLQRQRIVAEGTRCSASQEWFNTDLKINLATPVVVNGHLYGLGAAKDYVCVDARTGKVLWNQPGFDQVASTISDGRRLLVLLDTGECRLLAVNPERYEELGRFQACGKTYSHPAWAGDVLYVRDPREVVAYRLPVARN